jgi:hypothetical protein
MLKTRVTASIALLLAVVAVACSDGTAACYPGDYVTCACDAASTGYAMCGGDRTFGACDCGPAPFLPDGGPPEAAVDDSGLLPFLSGCSTNAQCASGLCFVYNAKGPHCTIPCSTDSDCPVPSTGCSNNKVCKVP